MRINWNEPRFGEEEIKEVTKVIEEAYVNEGPRTKILEEKFKNFLGVKHVIFTTNGTAALFLSIKADSLIKGIKDFEVIVPDLTMIATATAVGWAGGRPILVDALKNKMTLDTSKIKEKITPKTIAIIPVHILGRAVDMEEVNKIADENNLTVIEDAAGALASKSKGIFLGTFGKIGCFSLQSNKLITSGQGGVIVTNDDEYYGIIRRLRDFGRLNNKEFLHNIEGYNLKFNDLSAALALGQFNKIDEKKEILIKQRNQYIQELKEIKEVIFPKFEEGELPLWIDAFVERRDDLITHLKSSEIYPRACWPAVHRNPPYTDQGSDNDYPNSSFISDNVIWFPNGPAIKDKNINFICDQIKEFYKKNGI